MFLSMSLVNHLWLLDWTKDIVKYPKIHDDQLCVNCSSQTCVNCTAAGSDPVTGGISDGGDTNNDGIDDDDESVVSELVLRVE